MKFPSVKLPGVLSKEYKLNAVTIYRHLFRKMIFIDVTYFLSEQYLKCKMLKVSSLPMH